MTETETTCRFCAAIMTDIEKQFRGATCTNCHQEFETLTRRIGGGALFLLVLAALAVVFLTGQAKSQHWQPWNVESNPGTYSHPFTHTYRPMLLVQWDPRVTPYPLELHGLPWTQVNLTVREIVAFHPPGWTGTWTNPLGGTVHDIGLRLERDVSGTLSPLGVWPWSGLDYEYLRNLNIPLRGPGQFGIHYGNWVGRCCWSYTPRPILCAMVLEVGL